MKKEITWIGLVKETSDKLKKSGDTGGLKQAIKESKSVWTDIKSGKHPQYVQGKATRKPSKKGKKSKTAKKGRTSSNVDVDAKEILAKCKVCVKCQKKIFKYMKKRGHVDDE